MEAQQKKPESENRYEHRNIDKNRIGRPGGVIPSLFAAVARIQPADSRTVKV